MSELPTMLLAMLHGICAKEGEMEGGRDSSAARTELKGEDTGWAPVRGEPQTTSISEGNVSIGRNNHSFFLSFFLRATSHMSQEP